MSKNKVIKPVSFNKTKEDDVKMLKHVSRRNFSGYVKKLIMQDIKEQEMKKTFKEENKESEAITKKSIYEIAEEKKQQSTSQKLAQMKEQLKRPVPPSTSPKLFNNNKLSK